jgi:hypothetical protein
VGIDEEPRLYGECMMQFILWLDKILSRFLTPFDNLTEPSPSFGQRFLITRIIGDLLFALWMYLYVIPMVFDAFSVSSPVMRQIANGMYISILIIALVYFLLKGSRRIVEFSLLRKGEQLNHVVALNEYRQYLQLPGTLMAVGVLGVLILTLIIFATVFQTPFSKNLLEVLFWILVPIVGVFTFLHYFILEARVFRLAVANLSNVSFERNVNA